MVSGGAIKVADASWCGRSGFTTHRDLGCARRSVKSLIQSVLRKRQASPDLASSLQ